MGRGGARPGAGRKSNAEKLGIVALLDQCWTVESRQKVIDKLIERAEMGDLEAAKLLFAYRFGKPRQAVDVTVDDPNNVRKMSDAELEQYIRTHKRG